VPPFPLCASMTENASLKFLGCRFSRFRSKSNFIRVSHHLVFFFMISWTFLFYFVYFYSIFCLFLSFFYFLKLFLFLFLSQNICYMSAVLITCMRLFSEIEKQTSNVNITIWKKSQTSNVERQTSNVKRRTSNVERRTSNVKRRTSNVNITIWKITYFRSQFTH
jgi:hypothetical protein